MWNMDLSHFGTRVVLFIGQFLFLLVCILYLDFIYITNILPDKRAKETFQQTQCFVISKKLSVRGQLLHKFRSDFLISYNVNGVQYNRWVSGNGLDLSFGRNASDQEDILSKYDVGGTYPCWYDAKNAQVAILVGRTNWISTYPILVPAAAGIIILYFFVKNLFHILRTSKIKVRERRSRKTKK